MIDSERCAFAGASLESVQVANAIVITKITIFHLWHTTNTPQAVVEIIVVDVKLGKKTLKQKITRAVYRRDAAELVGRIPQAA